MIISQTHHITKNGTLKKNPISTNKEIRELIRAKEEVVQNELKMMVNLASMRIAPVDCELQSMVASRILLLVNNSYCMSESEIKDHIKKLDEDIYRYKNGKNTFW